MKTKDQTLLEEAYGEVSANQSKKRLLARIKPEFRKLYIKDLEHFNGSYRDHADFLNKAKEMGHLVEEVCEGFSNRVDYFEAALKNPMDYELVLNSDQDEDWEGNTIYRTVAYIYKNGNHRDCDRFGNEDEIDQLKDAFEKHNPEGINDQR